MATTLRLHQYQLLNYIRVIRNKKSFDITLHSTKWHPQKATSNETRDPPTTQASCAIARSSRLQVASRARRTGAAKIRYPVNGGGASIIVVKLLRTDTTLDLSQKARVVRNHKETDGFI